MRNGDGTCQRNVKISKHVHTERQNFESRKRALDFNRISTEHHEHLNKHVTGNTPQTVRKPISNPIRRSDIRQSDIRHPAIRQPTLHKETTKNNKPKLYKSRAKRKLARLAMAKRRWDVPTEYRKTGARARGTSEFRIVEASLGLQPNGN